METTFPLFPATHYQWIYLAFLAGIGVCIFSFFAQKKAAAQNPSHRKFLVARYVLPAVVVILIGASITIYQQANALLVVDENGGLRIKAGLYSLTLAAEDLKVEEAEILDLHAREDLRPVARTNGTAAGDLWAGWFRLADGRKAYVLVTNPSASVYLPTKDYVLLLSPQWPEEFIVEIQSYR